jgi:hypothetical protein
MTLIERAEAEILREFVLHVDLEYPELREKVTRMFWGLDTMSVDDAEKFAGLLPVERELLAQCLLEIVGASGVPA